MDKRKILVSPGYGAGWSTWNSGEVAKYMLTYKPIIEFLENGGRFSQEDCQGRTAGGGPRHKLLKQLQQECKEKFGVDYVCVLGADGLEVHTVTGRVRLHEYDGAESFEEEGEFDDWM